MILVDTNVLLRLADPVSPQRLISRTALQKLHHSGQNPAVVPQNFYEFWAVATRSTGKINGMGMPPQRAGAWLNYLGRRFQVLPETEQFLIEWRRLMAVNPTSGGKSHDARLVAAMVVHKIDQILTFNTDDFKAYGVVVVDPSSV